jgi:hypothetical protein
MSGGETMGGAISKCDDTVDEVIDICGQSPVAAATSSVLYSLQYGGGGGYGDDSADSNESHSGKASGKADCDEDDDYILDGLIFSNDEDFIRYFQRTPRQQMATCLLLHLVSCLGMRTQRTGLPFGILC